MNNAQAWQRREAPAASDTLQSIAGKLHASRQDPGRIERIEIDGIYPMGVFPATHAIACVLGVDALRLHLSPSLPRDDIAQSLRSLADLELTDQAQLADLLLCNEFDCPALDSLVDADPESGTARKTLIIQCKSFFRGITYQTAGPAIRRSRKLRCSAFNGPLIHQRRKLPPQAPAIDLIIVSGCEFFCVPAETRLLAAAR